MFVKVFLGPENVIKLLYLLKAHHSYFNNLTFPIVKLILR